MFKKCLKYDFKSTFSVWWIAAVTILLLSIPSGMILRNLIIDENPDSIFPLETLWALFYYFTIIAFMLLTEILIFIRYYNNFFGDEGYLTFTLPVKRRTLFFSKVTSALLFQVMSGIVIVLSVCIIGAFLPSENYNSLLVEFVAGFGNFLYEGFDAIGMWLPVYIVQLAGIVIAGSLLSILLTFLFTTIGGVLVKRYKLFLTIGIIYGSGTVLSVLSFPASILYTLWAVSASYLEPSNFEWIFALILAFIFLAQLTAIVGIALAILGCLERKLNLP